MFSSLKNLPPITAYLISVVCFVLANVIRDKSVPVYYLLLILGIVFFIFGLTKRIKKQ